MFQNLATTPVIDQERVFIWSWSFYYRFLRDFFYSVSFFGKIPYVFPTVSFSKKDPTGQLVLFDNYEAAALEDIWDGKEMPSKEHDDADVRCCSFLYNLRFIDNEMDS